MKNIFVITLGSILMAFTLNLFLIPHKVILGGVSGIGMIISYLTSIDAGWAILVLNVPIFILGLIFLGGKFVSYSIYSVILTSVAMEYIPVKAISDDIVISSVFGGVLAGIAIGIIIKNNGSTGGLDIVGLILTRKRDFPLGNLMFLLNSFVVALSGFLIGWEQTLYTLLTIYVSGKLVDVIHTKHIKLTLMIITNKGDEIKEEMLGKIGRGITIIDGEGAFTQEKRKVLITVISRYELENVKKLIHSIDDNAFVNITQTIEVMGMFKKTS